MLLVKKIVSLSPALHMRKCGSNGVNFLFPVFLPEVHVISFFVEGFFIVTNFCPV